MADVKKPVGTITMRSPIDGAVAISQAKKTEAQITDEAVEIVTSTGADYTETRDSVAKGQSSVSIEAGKIAQNNIQTSVDTAVQSTNIPVEEAALNLDQTLEKSKTVAELRSNLIEGTFSMNSDLYSPTQQQVMLRTQKALDIINDTFSDTQDRGMFKNALAWIERELVLYVVNGLPDDLTRATQTEGKEILAAAINLNDEEFESFMRQKAQAKFDEGILFEGTKGALGDITTATTTAGIDPDAETRQLFAVIEGITLGFPVAKGAAKGVKGAAKLISGKAPVSRAGVTGGQRAADEAAENLLKSEARDVPSVREDLQVDNANITRGTSETVGPRQSTLTSRLDENVLIQQVKKQASSKIAQGPADDLVELAIGRVTAAIQKDITRPLINTRVVDRTGLGADTLQMNFGKMKDASPFQGTASGKASAQKFANKLNENATTGGKTSGARVVEVEEGNPKSGYMVQVEAPVDLRTAYDAVKLDEVTNNWIKAQLLSTRSTTDAATDIAASTAMSSQGTYRKLAADIMKPYNSLKGKTKAIIDDVMSDLRDGPDAYIKAGYTEREFAQKFADKHPKGRYPTDAEVDAYLAVRDLNDASYFIKGNRIRTKLENDGFKAIEFGGNTRPARLVKNLAELADDVPVISGRSGNRINKGELLEDANVWELMDEIDGIKHVLAPSNVRLLDVPDVLRYNAGGPRTNPHARYFVAESTGDGRAFMAAFSENQARKGAEQLENIFAAARKGGRPLDELVDELDDVIAKNNSWNPSIVDTADFIRIAKDKGWDVSQKVSYKARDQKVQGIERSPFNGMTQSDMHSMVRARNDDVLMEYGGGQAFNEKPVKTMADAFDKEVGELSMRYYNYQAKTGFLKNIFDDLPQGADIEMLYREEVRRIQDIGPLSRTDKERRLMTLANTISRREGVEGPLSGGLANMRRMMENFIFDKSISFKLDPNGWRVTIPKPENLLLQMGFRSAFAWNPSQWVLQGSHMVMIGAISPRSGFKAAAAMPFFKMVMNSGEASAKKLGYERISKSLGIDVDTLEAAEYYFRTSGRDIIENDTVYLGAGMDGTVGSFGHSKPAQLIKAADKLSMKPFNYGESAARSTAILTAADELAREFGVKFLKTPEGLAKLARREQDLTFNMTNSSRGGAQAGLGAVPTQWMTYIRNAFETIVVGRGFTAAERARMGLGFLALAGTGTIPFVGDATEKGLDAAGVEANGGVHTLVTQGVLDFLMTEAVQGITGDQNAGTNLSNRLSLFGGISDLMAKSEEGVVQFALGPSGQIVGPAFAKAMEILVGVGSIGTGRGDYTWEFFKSDLQRIPRTMTGVDNIIKGYGMWKNGVYISKDGATVPFEFSPAEAVIQMLGIQPDRLGEWYEAKSANYGTGKVFSATKKEVTRRMDQTVELMKTDPDAARENLRAIDSIINGADITHVQRRKLTRDLMSGGYSQKVLDLFEYYIGMDKDYKATSLDNLE